jgi:2-keto-4-pentenoate hydratase/2-oxohepta-3-ene-1,7-dioic acid hydratase in catechol pathway
MRLVRWGAPGRERPALLDSGGNLEDLSSHIPDIGAEVLLPSSLASLAQIEADKLPFVPRGARIGPCVARVGKIVAVGLNYRDHAAESNMAIPDEPPLFLKPPSAIVGPNDEVEIPLDGLKTDWEVELGVVIGKPAKYVSESEAMEHVAGYCIVNDVSERAFQLERGGQWDKGKGCDTFAPVGPWLVTADEIANLHALNLWLDVDGVRRQTGNTRTMIFSVPFLIAYISRFMSLQSGDIISTGTPPGVGYGMKPPQYLRPGQMMRLGITGLGVQEQRTVPAQLPATVSHA